MPIDEGVTDTVALSADGIVEGVYEHARVDLTTVVDPKRANRLGLGVVAIAWMGDSGEDPEKAHGRFAEATREGAEDYGPYSRSRMGYSVL